MAFTPHHLRVESKDPQMYIIFVRIGQPKLVIGYRTKFCAFNLRTGGGGVCAAKGLGNPSYPMRFFQIFNCPPIPYFFFVLAVPLPFLESPIALESYIYRTKAVFFLF